MRVSPVDLDACGSCNFQPLINVLRPNEPTVFDDINAITIEDPDYEENESCHAFV